MEGGTHLCIVDVVKAEVGCAGVRPYEAGHFPADWDDVDGCLGWPFSGFVGGEYVDEALEREPWGRSAREEDARPRISLDGFCADLVWVVPCSDGEATAGRVSPRERMPPQVLRT